MIFASSGASLPSACTSHSPTEPPMHTSSLRVHKGCGDQAWLVALGKGEDRASAQRRHRLNTPPPAAPCLPGAPGAMGGAMGSLNRRCAGHQGQAGSVPPRSQLGDVAG